MIAITIACRDAAVEQLLRRLGVRQGDSQFTGPVERETEILPVETNAESGVEAVVDHALAVHFQHARRGEAAHECLTHACRFDPRPCGEYERFRNRFDVQSHHDLVCDLGDLSCAGFADVGDGPSHQRKKRTDTVDSRLFAAAHDRQRGVAGTDLSA